MEIEHLVEKSEKFYWSHNGELAKARKIGGPVKHDLSKVHPSYLNDKDGPLSIACQLAPIRTRLPEGISLQVCELERDLESQPPYITVQYLAVEN